MDPKKILIAVDASENSARAVNYVADLLGGSSGFMITVLYIERPPNRDLFPDEASWVEAGQAQELRIRTFLKQARTTLTAGGLAPEAVTGPGTGLDKDGGRRSTRGRRSAASARPSPATSCSTSSAGTSGPWSSDAVACPGPRSSCSAA